MGETLTVDPRFCGPPDTGNGGYVAGLLAARLGGSGGGSGGSGGGGGSGGSGGGSAEITLRLPAPVGTGLTVTAEEDGRVTLRNNDAVLAVAASGRPELELPDPVSLADAREAAARCRLRTHPQEHPYPGCFVCGPDRGPGDGLGIMVGPVAGRDVAADVWYPDGSLAGPDGEVAAEFLWAALDCPGGVGAIGAEFVGGAPWVLGRFAACQQAPVRAGEPHVTVGWRIAHEGRKLLAGSAVLTPDGAVAGYARATWIQLRS